jgi:hypothetical protein
MIKSFKCKETEKIYNREVESCLLKFKGLPTANFGT